MNNLVIVESPAKATTIEKILGKDFKVVSSYGHIRDLAKKNMGIDINNSFTPTYEVSVDKKSILKNLLKESVKSDVVWLATDEDREGEAIAWHLYEVLALKNKKVHRIVFNEITKNAIKSAITSPRDINQNLVDAQQARRVLDRLVGFKLSPILWKKVRTGLSAGRVQSVAVRLIVDRETSITKFISESSYIISADFLTSNSETLPTILSHKFSSKEEVLDLFSSFKTALFRIDSIEKTPSKSSPSAPFTTSSLQQVASARLGFSVSRTMSVAQKLYEAGHITYMRTDSTNLSTEATSNIEKYILSYYGKKYLDLRKYSTKTKVAQEAHEAIRPTNFDQLSCGVDDAQKKLYKLIWERTVCSQMSSAMFDKTSINISFNKTIDGIDKDLFFQGKGQVITFDGYLRVQQTAASLNKKDVLLPVVKLDEELNPKLFSAREKFSKPPTRFTEASLVKKLEELGIGRPSTYAPTISTIQKREYVLKEDKEGVLKEHNCLLLENNKITEKVVEEVLGTEKKKLIPTEIGKITTGFLVENFSDILDYNFTATVEDHFDNIATGDRQWTEVISTFYKQFHPKVLEVDKSSTKVTGLRDLGIDPLTKKTVYVRLGKYGPIVQLGNEELDNEKPKYAKLRKGQTMESLDLTSALLLFSLPRKVGDLDSEDIVVSEGRYGPYIKYKNKFISLSPHDPFEVNLNTCIEIIKKNQEFEKQRVINVFNLDDEIIEVLNGKYGPYVKHKKKNYKIPKDLEPKKLTKEDCLNLINKTNKK